MGALCANSLTVAVTTGRRPEAAMMSPMTILPSGVSEDWVGDGAASRQSRPLPITARPRALPVSATDRLPYGHLKTPLIPDAPASGVPQDGPDAGIDF